MGGADSGGSGRKALPGQKVIEALGRIFKSGLSAGAIADVLWPKMCASCETALKPGSKYEVCPDCLEGAEYLARPYCEICGDPFTVTAEDDWSRMNGRTCANCRRERPRFSIARAACRYEGRVRRMIHAFKFEGRKSLSRTLAAIIGSKGEELSAVTAGVDVVTAVPLARERERQRGYNQSFLLAESLAPVMGLDSPSILLRKVRVTDTQVGLPREKRLVNVSKAFEVTEGVEVGDKVVLLVDDVMTTGATVSECARALCKSGAKEVRVLSAARG